MTQLVLNATGGNLYPALFYNVSSEIMDLQMPRCSVPAGMRKAPNLCSRTWQRRLALIAWLAIALAIFLPVISQGADGDMSPAITAAPGTTAAPAAVLQGLDEGKPQELIILFDDSAIVTEADARRRRAGLGLDDELILKFKSEGYRLLKQQVKTVAPLEAETIKDYSHLPMLFMRFNSRQALGKVLARPEVIAVYENRRIYPDLTYSLPFINQPAVAALGMTGSGVTVATIDTGINYTLAAFGSCTAPGVPAGCKVSASVDVTGNGVTLNTDPNNHGTNVAGIIVGVAPGAAIASVNAFSNGSSTDVLVIDGINWAIANKSAYNIVAINMSLGDGADYTSPCANSHSNSYVKPVANALSAGIRPIASSGNSAFTNGISSPACTPGVVSVGAVYDANWGDPYTWSGSNCTDTTTGPDIIPCFSNSASFLTLLAPGAFITAAGIQMAGTSQASPHVAGAWAVLTSAKPAATQTEILNALVNTGKSVTDPRNGIVKPRLQLDQAAYALVPFTISDSVVNGVGGTITSSLPTVPYGGSVTFTITSDPGYTLTGLTDNGVNVSAVEGPAGTFTYSLSNVTANHAVVATFAVAAAATVSALPPFGLSAAILIAAFSGYGRFFRMRKNG